MAGEPVGSFFRGYCVASPAAYVGSIHAMCAAAPTTDRKSSNLAVNLEADCTTRPYVLCINGQRLVQEVTSANNRKVNQRKASIHDLCDCPCFAHTVDLRIIGRRPL